MPKPAPADTLELPPRLRCEAGQLVKPSGKPIWLHGVCFGAWWEDDEQDCPGIATLGANALREALRFWGTWGKGEGANPDCRDDKAYAFVNREKVQTWLGRIQAASAAGLWSVPFIDSNCGQSGTNSPEDIAYCDPYGTWGASGHNFYTDEGMLKMYAEVVWPSVAARLRTMSRIAMLEIHPEPAHQRPDSWRPRIVHVQKTIIDAIRLVDADTPILVGAMPGYSISSVKDHYLALRDAYGGMLPEGLVWTGNLLGGYTADPPKFDRGLQHLVDLREKYGATVFVQQVGRESDLDPDLACMRHAVAALREANVGYTWWEWKQHASQPDGLGLNYPDPDIEGAWIAKTNELAILADDWGGALP
jgi:hypothetical protein